MPKKAIKKAKKKAEPEAADIVNAPTPAPQHEPDQPELNAATLAGVDTKGEPPAQPVTPAASEGEPEALAQAADTFEQAYEGLPPERSEPKTVAVNVPELEKSQAETEEAEAPEPEPHSETVEAFAEERPPARLERLQKILSQAGIASRRHAEEMIAQGRVQVNGKVVTELGTKADPTRDHIRVDGKLIHGAERLRYFVFNKPRGYVTTVSDPEGRPTVMEFFRKMGERLYPVGRLDYQSEGLLLVTNDGDLANKLTKAATGVEKTYLVKVSGQPTAEELDRLREGVAIDRTRPGEGRVRTSQATIREARPGDNPWYEVVLTEGRNRELRKMFEEIGHHVEKIRRVGYGPLVLDVEPGRFRELEPGELAKLRLAAEGKWRKPKPPGSPATGLRRSGGKPREIRYEEGRRPPGREAQPARQRRQEGRGAVRQEDRSRIEEHPFRGRPSRGKGEWRKATQGEGFWRSRTEGSGKEQGFGRPAKKAWQSQGSKPDRQRKEWDRGGAGRQDRQREGASRQDRPGTASRYQESRPRFDRPRSEDREARRGPGERTSSRPPRRGSQAPQERPAPPPRPGKGKFGARTQQPAGEFRGGRPGTLRSGGRNAGRPNRPSAPGGGKPSFKKTSGRTGPSRDRSNPRRRRD